MRQAILGALCAISVCVLLAFAAPTPTTSPNLARTWSGSEARGSAGNWRWNVYPQALQSRLLVKQIEITNGAAQKLRVYIGGALHYEQTFTTFTRNNGDFITFEPGLIVNGDQDLELEAIGAGGGGNTITWHVRGTH